MISQGRFRVEEWAIRESGLDLGLLCTTLHVVLTRDGASPPSGKEGASLHFLHDGEPVDLVPGETVVSPLTQVEALPTPEQPAGRAPQAWPGTPGATPAAEA